MCYRNPNLFCVKKHFSETFIKSKTIKQTNKTTGLLYTLYANLITIHSYNKDHNYKDNEFSIAIRIAEHKQKFIVYSRVYKQ